jgi:prepilin signal peptidase PulO-like enzyme (type II secretory pathway)
MLPLLLALLGIPAGLAVDALAVRLALPPQGGEGNARPARRTSLHAETGTLVIAAGETRPAWLRRLLIVGATSTAFAVAGARYDDPSHLAVICAYAGVLVLCAATDLMSYRVPNAVTYPAVAGALAVGAVMPGASLLDAIIGGVLAGGILLLPALLSGGVGMGMGDVKLAAFAGFAVGFSHTAAAMLVMAFTGGAVALVLMLTRLRRRGEPIPYAPFISIGALVALLWQGAAFVDLV